MGEELLIEESRHQRLSHNAFFWALVMASTDNWHRPSDAAPYLESCRDCLPTEAVSRKLGSTEGATLWKQPALACAKDGLVMEARFSEWCFQGFLGFRVKLGPGRRSRTGYGEAHPIFACAGCAEPRGSRAKTVFILRVQMG